MPFDAQRAVASPTGASLNLYVKRAQGAPRAVVQINHGLAEHAARYGRFADFLAERGFHAYAHDHRGHGETTAPDAPPGRFGTPSGADKVIADVGVIHALIHAEHPGLPVVMFGHSMGGMIVLNRLLRHPGGVHAAAIWNANFSVGLAGRAAQAILAWEQFRLGSDAVSRMLPRLTFRAWGRQVPGHATPFDWLSRDTDEVRRYIDDPLCGWDPSVSMWQDVFGFAYAGAADANVAAIPRALPINLVGGANDPATDGGRSVGQLAGRLGRLGFSQVVSTIYADTRHESLNEVNRDAVMHDFAGWVEATLEKREMPGPQDPTRLHPAG
ncbi:alpha/beta fold hydrolase [Mesorhizobium sp. ZMM04-5]|uniref:Alpha/beta fold hydrolase n=1 Tax=Mesorhizobium marinum TaxID=3228790 RepID=A0ABV3QUX0_9HYPH